MALLLGGPDVFDPLIFDSLLWGDRRRSSAATSRDVATVPVDWKETSDSHIFKANLPGVSKEEVKVEVDEGRVLQISGERRKEEAAEGDRWHRAERTSGRFLWRFRLPENAKVDDVKACMENGVLTLTISKIPKPAPKTIEISG